MCSYPLVALLCSVHTYPPSIFPSGSLSSSLSLLISLCRSVSLYLSLSLSLYIYPLLSFLCMCLSLCFLLPLCLSLSLSLSLSLCVCVCVCVFLRGLGVLGVGTARVSTADTTSHCFWPTLCSSSRRRRLCLRRQRCLCRVHLVHRTRCRCLSRCSLTWSWRKCPAGSAARWTNSFTYSSSRRRCQRSVSQSRCRCRGHDQAAGATSCGRVRAGAHRRAQDRQYFVQRRLQLRRL